MATASKATGKKALESAKVAASLTGTNVMDNDSARVVTDRVVATSAQPMGKRPDIASDIFKDTLTINFANGKTIEVDVTKLSPEIQKQAMLHGLKQKLVDAAAIARNTETGRSATISDKYDAVREVADRVMGEGATWNKVREAGAAGGSSSLLARALVAMSGKSRAEIDAYLETKSKEEKAALRSSSKVAAIILTLQASSSKSSVDSAELLGELGL